MDDDVIWTRNVHAGPMTLRMAVVVLATVLAGCPAEPEAPLLGLIQVDPFLPTTESAVIFSISIDNEQDGPFLYSWDFGDGESSTSPEPSHRFTTAGEYGVSVTVANDAGSATDTQRVVVSTADADLYFWTQSTANGNIQVTINGTSKFVVAAHPQFPGCAIGSGLAEFVDLPYGTYTYNAVAQSGMTWNGTVVLNDHCTNVPLN